MYTNRNRCQPDLSSFFIILAAIVIVNAIFVTAYQWDNKYKSKAPRGSEGSLALSENDLEKNAIIPLADGWTFYPDCTLDGRGEIAGENSNAPKTIFIGQFPSFSFFHDDVSPYGRGVYELKLQAEESLGPLLLQMPEIYSASQVWVNGALVSALGSPDEDSYRPLVQNLIIPLPPGSSNIRIFAANYTHYYSGLTYPPILGRPDAISALTSSKLAIYGLLCFFTLGVSAVSVIFWLLRPKNRLSLVYGLMCLCYSFHVSYPFLAWKGFSHIRFFYGMEDFTYWAMLLCMTIITQMMIEKRAAADNVFLSVSLFYCLLVPAGSLFLSPYPQWISVYGLLVPIGKCILAVYLTVSALRVFLSNKRIQWLLAGNLVFAIGILSDFWTAGYFEPLRFLWLDEYCGIFIVLCFTALIISYHLTLSREYEHLTRHLEKEVDRQTAHLTILLKERRQLLSGIAHDMKAPLTAIKAYIDLIHEEEIGLDEEVKSYLDVIGQKSTALEKHLENLQLYNREESGEESLVPCLARQFLSNVYEETKPYADAGGIHFLLLLPSEDRTIFITRNRLMRALENIIFNAVQHTPEEGEILLTLRFHGEKAEVEIKDSGFGISPETLSHIFEYGFTTSSGPGNISRGLGLYFAKLTVEECSGTVTAGSVPGEGTCFTVSLPVTSQT